ncbi:MAG TPA: NTP transferase domain-containing protein, partial [Thermomicrobiales bacterium]|nr:NTP transferase domain-containing protein [Thermomicrobiales bacterium]
MSEPAPDPSPTHGPRCVAVVLAAGQGSRMRSDLPKPLHPVAGVPMLSHVLRAVAAAEPVRTILVVRPDSTDLPMRLGLGPDVTVVAQDPPRGTGDALRRAFPVVGDADLVLVVFADHPLLDAGTVGRLRDSAAATGALVTVLSVPVAEGSYGRLDSDAEGRLRRIVERKDDDVAERAG